MAESNTQSCGQAHGSLDDVLYPEQSLGNASRDRGISISEAGNGTPGPQDVTNWIEWPVHALSTDGVDLATAIPHVATNPIPTAPAASPSPSSSKEIDDRPVFFVGANANDLAAMSREMSRTISLDQSADSEVAGTQCVGPLNIREIPAVAVRGDPAARYRFRFVLDETNPPSEPLEPLEFIYSTSDDLVEQIENWLWELDLGYDLLTPIRFAVEAALGEEHQIGWQLSVGAPSTGSVHTIATTSTATQTSSNSKRPSSMMQQKLPQTTSELASNCQVWMHERKAVNNDSFYKCQYSPATSSLQITCGQTLQQFEDCPVVLGEISKSCHSFSTTEFLNLASDAVLSDLGKMIFAQAVIKIVSTTLVTVAQMLHIGGTNCRCDMDDFFEQEEFQIEVRRRFNTILPPLQHRKPQLHQQRVRYVFELLKHVMSAMNQPLERFIPD